MWKRMTICRDSPFFPVFLQIVKQTTKGQESVTKTIINRKRSQKIKQQVIETYRFDFDWQDEDTVGIEVFKQIGENNAKPA